MTNKSFEKIVQLRCGNKRAKVYARRAPAPKGAADQLRKCAACGSANAPVKKNCWVCNGPLAEAAPAPAEGTFWLMKLELERKVYWSTDENLNASVQQLFADLAADDFSQSAFQAWVNREQMRVESAKGTARVSARHMTETASLLFIFRVVTALVCTGTILWMLYILWADLRATQ